MWKEKRLQDCDKKIIACVIATFTAESNSLSIAVTPNRQKSRQGIDRPGLNLMILVHMSRSARGFAVSVFFANPPLKWFQICFSFWS
jgi:hypothetical protein